MDKENKIGLGDTRDLMVYNEVHWFICRRCRKITSLTIDSRHPDKPLVCSLCGALCDEWVDIVPKQIILEVLKNKQKNKEEK